MSESRFGDAILNVVDNVEVVLVNNDRVTLRVGATFLKVDADQTRTDIEVEAIALAPVPTPEILWRKPPVLALAAVPGRTLGRLGEPSTASPAAWAAAGAAMNRLRSRPCHTLHSRRYSRSGSDLDLGWVVPATNPQ